MVSLSRRDTRSSADLLARGLRASWVVVIAFLSGCYSLVPVDMESAAPPMRVRAHLSPAAVERIAPALGEPRAELDGRLVERTSRGIFLEVRSGDVQSGFGTQSLTQRILLEPQDLVALQRRELDRTRTTLLAGLGVALVGVVVYESFTGETGGTVGGGPVPGPPEARLPLIRFPVR